MAHPRLSPSMQREQQKRQGGKQRTQTQVNKTAHESLRNGFTKVK